MSLTVVNWNVRWATPQSKRSPEILSRIHEHSPDIVCLSETSNRLWDHKDFAIWPQPCYGYPVIPGRRKVALWSRKPWRRVDWRGSADFPPGRFVSGVTETPVGDVTVVGVCIPWRNSRTPKNRGNRSVWQDHLQYLDALDAALDRMAASRLIVMGDYNQRIGAGPNTAPQHVRDRLQSAIAARLKIITADLHFRDRKSIDHIAINGGLSVRSIGIISNCKDKPEDLSDHYGVTATLTNHK